MEKGTGKAFSSKHLPYTMLRWRKRRGDKDQYMYTDQSLGRKKREEERK